MILLVDCSLNYIEIAIIKDNDIMDSIYKEQNKNLTKILIPTVDEIITKNNLSKKDIHSIYVINGPGSFTSIKLVSIFANTWNSIMMVNLYQLDTCQWHALKDIKISYLDAKTNLWYVKIIENKSDIQLISREELNQLLLNINPNKTIDCLLKTNIEDKWNYNKNNFIKVKKITPLYIKKAI